MQRQALFLVALAWTGCVGQVGGAPEEAANGPAPSGEFVDGCGAACDAPGEASRLVRLSHAQWGNSVRDLLGLSEVPSLVSSFSADARGSAFDTAAQTFVVGSTLWGDYQRAAESLALTVTQSDAAMSRLLPPGLPASGDVEARARAFVNGFGLRAFRRPLTDAELSRYVALFTRGTALTGEADAFRAGVRIVLTAMLQSPGFLYRVETSAGEKGGLIPLDGFERATRLSYALWNSTPDDALLAAAGDGSLDTPEGVEREARRLLADPRARETLSRFHAQLLELDLYRQVVRDPVKLPGVTSTLAESLARESELFVDDVVSAREGGLTGLLTGRTGFVNGDLAPLYGLQGTYGAEWKPVELDASQRAGILTRLGFTTYYGHDVDSDPIRRGVFVNLRLLCAQLPPPPDNVPPLPPLNGGTMREVVTAHTGAGTCGGACHATMINPIGFAFENYDGVGRWRTQDHGKPVDASAEYTLQDGSVLRYANAVELSQKLSGVLQTHRCYSRNWLEYLYGREPSTSDDNLVTRLGKASLRGEGARALVLQAVTSKAFLYRRPEAQTR